jgi:hypothetical protein
MLARGEFDQFSVAGNSPASGIQSQASQSQSPGLLRTATAQESAASRKQFGEGKGLHQVVICARIQPLNTVFNRITGREQQDRNSDSVAPHLSENLAPAASRQHDVQQNQVE